MIWQGIAEGFIAEAQPRAYQEAAAYLRSMRDVYFRKGQREEWQALLAELRTQHKRKRRLMEVLDELEGEGWVA